LGAILLRATNLFNVNPDFSLRGVTDNSATSDYHALQLTFQRRLSRGLQGLASYSFSHSIDMRSSDTAAGNLKHTRLDCQSARLTVEIPIFDIRHSFTAGVTYDLPSPESHKLVSMVLRGWSLDSFIFARSAPPVDIVGGTFFVAGVALAPRPNVNPECLLNSLGRNILAARFSIARLSRRHPLDSREISDAMCCEVWRLAS